MPDIARILADTSYHGHAVLVVHMDSEPYMHTACDGQNGELPARAGDEFCQLVYKYAKDLESCASGIATQAGARHEAGVQAERFLYNPAALVTFGHTDNLALVVVDSFDFVDCIVQSGLPVCQTSLAFCPRLDSLGVTKANGSPFCEISDVCDGARSRPGNPTVSHPFIEERPLVGMTYYRLSSLVTLGPGLLLQQAVYRAMIRRITATLTRLRDREQEYQGVLWPGDVDSFRCVLLDPQGWSEIATVMFCRNYSVITAVVSALRSLRLVDIYRAAPSAGGEDGLREKVRLFGVHAKLATISESMPEACRGGNVPQDLDENHVFCSSLTTLGMSHAAFFDSAGAEPDTSKSHGIVYASPRLAIPPGHKLQVDDIDERRLTEHEGAAAVPVSLDGTQYEWCLAGTADCTYEAAAFSHCILVRSQPLADVVRTSMRLRFGGTGPGEPTPCPQCLEGVCTDLHVLTPQVRFDDGAGEGGADGITTVDGHVNLRPILSRMNARLFESPDGALSIPKLQKAIAQLRLPAPLSTEIACLYVDFAAALADPFRYEKVLDLRDMFAAVHSLLSTDLPEKLAKQAATADGAAGKESLRLSLLSAGDIEEIAFLLDVMQDALRCRTAAGLADAVRWHPVRDFRMGLSRLVNASDSTLKCALGVLRMVADSPALFGEFAHHEAGDANAGQAGTAFGKWVIAGAKKVSRFPRPVSTRMYIGRDEGFYLAALSAHLRDFLEPENLCADFHESSHLICDLLRTAACPRKEDNHEICLRQVCYRAPVVDGERPGSKALSTRYEEIFCELLLCGLVFDRDHRTFLRSYVASYFQDAASTPANRRTLLWRMVEILFRGFLASDPYREPKTKDDSGKDCLLYEAPDHTLTDEDIAEGQGRFLEAVKDAGPLFFDFADLWFNDGPAKAYAEAEFERVFRDSYLPLRCIWKDAGLIFDAVCKGNDETVAGTDPPENDRTALTGQIEKALASGTPVVRLMYADPRTETSPPRAAKREKYGHLDSFFLIRQILGRLVRSLCGPDVLDTRSPVHTVGNPEATNFPTAEDVFSQGTPQAGDTKANDRFLSRTRGGFIYVGLHGRREVMKRRIATLKTLWDISASHRARRLSHLINLAWPEFFDESDASHDT